MSWKSGHGTNPRPFRGGGRNGYSYNHQITEKFNISEEIICVSNSSGLWIQNQKCFFLTSSTFHARRRLRTPLSGAFRLPPKNSGVKVTSSPKPQFLRTEKQPCARRPPPVYREPQVEATIFQAGSGGTLALAPKDRPAAHSPG